MPGLLDAGAARHNGQTSGNSSLKFTVPAGSVGAAAGNFAMNFSRDMSVQFGKGRLIQGCGRDVGPIGMVPSIKRRWGPDT